MAIKTRRPHRKSRNGCLECKHRHIRCDERRPSCGNCDAAERICSFLMQQAASRVNAQETPSASAALRRRQHADRTASTSPNALETDSQSSATVVATTDDEHAKSQPAPVSVPTPAPQPANSHPYPSQSVQMLRFQMLMQSSPSTGARLNADADRIVPSALSTSLYNAHTSSTRADSCPGLSIIPDTASKAMFTPEHMVLMQHANAVPNFTGPGRSVVDIAVQHAIDSPYLLDEILAFTAFHMSKLYPGSAVYLRHLATELQNRGLATFTQLSKMVSNDDKATAVPRFLFSAILGRHVLSDTLTYCGSDFYFFIDRFIECINLNRGIRSVTPPAWDYIFNSEMQPFIRVVLEAEQKITTPGSECDPLIQVMDDSDLNETSMTACRQAIQVLQWSFDLCRELDVEEYPQAASAFSVRTGAGFVDVLRKHRPEALLILSYYGVLLYRCHSFWAFGDAGGPLIRAIAAQLGTYWRDALAWPLHVLETERPDI